MTTAGDHRKLQLLELDELRHEAYENSCISKEKTKAFMINTLFGSHSLLIKKCGSLTLSFASFRESFGHDGMAFLLFLMYSLMELLKSKTQKQDKFLK
ncbi:hypothetical protein Pint_09512 [Pistacia integerrima]|uniref:Uncharacterized protein n=1 Tax=Pistacia integerrima TaxID=434235 RepID=A0ACC0XM73_9ROSI|nr:hypothetical protein Pint_09512 [Pistacia integerrima]